MRYALIALIALAATGCVAFPEREQFTVFPARDVCAAEDHPTMARNVTRGALHGGLFTTLVTLGQFPTLSALGAIMGGGIGASVTLADERALRECP